MPLNAQQLNTATFAELLADTHHTAVHLEMRDQYAVGDETDDYAAFLRTGVPNLDPARSFWPQWTPLVRDAVARGVVMRRARIVSEPVTDYIRYKHAITPLNLQAGEDVRWLPRRHASCCGSFRVITVEGADLCVAHSGERKDGHELRPAAGIETGEGGS
ncbi:DUF6879 family protein [Streptomyces sp. NPDC006197]|uniref:DUF6879 family protein n=1 Tax=Streptomyces sp. NPDC006197 TaxID=3156685 RepID=UPI0033A4CEE6